MRLVLSYTCSTLYWTLGIILLRSQSRIHPLRPSPHVYVLFLKTGLPHLHFKRTSCPLKHWFKKYLHPHENRKHVKHCQQKAKATFIPTLDSVTNNYTRPKLTVISLNTTSHESTKAFAIYHHLFSSAKFAGNFFLTTLTGNLITVVWPLVCGRSSSQRENREVLDIRKLACHSSGRTTWFSKLSFQPEVQWCLVMGVCVECSSDIPSTL